MYVKNVTYKTAIKMTYARQIKTKDAKQNGKDGSYRRKALTEGRIGQGQGLPHGGVLEIHGIRGVYILNISYHAEAKQRRFFRRATANTIRDSRKESGIYVP